MLKLINLYKTYPKLEEPILNGLDLELSEGERFSLIGPSGSGKTTLLRLIAGLEELQSGLIQLEGKVLISDSVNVPPAHRQVGLLFQEHALFQHLTVEGNICFGLGRWDKKEQDQRVEHLISLTQLNGLEGRKPQQLSEGQRQRVALARSIAPKPKLLLLDEPFEHLEPRLRKQTASYTQDLLTEEGITVILVTHHLKEAQQFSDRIGVLLDGKIHSLEGLLEGVGSSVNSKAVQEFLDDSYED